jgi:hypothetical protein
MIMFVVPLMIILLWLVAIKARKAGLTGGKVALIVAVGAVCIVVATFGILAWGFSNFG